VIDNKKLHLSLINSNTPWIH